jgi:diguanylate cyclase (GGDEF)-like protein
MLRFLIALLLFSTSLLADQVSDFSKKVNLYERGVVFENAQTPMSIEAILALPNSQWSAPASANFDQTFSTSEFWFRAPLDWANYNDSHVNIVAEMPVQDYIDLWFIDANNQVVSEYHTGDRLPLSARPNKGRFFSFPIPDHSAEGYEVVIRLDTHDGLFEPGPLVMQSVDSFTVSNLFEFFIYGFLYGGLIWIGSYNLLLYISHRDIRFLKYAGYIACFVIFHFSFRGFAAIYWWTDNTWWSNQVKPIAVILVYMMLYLFGTDMLNTRVNFPKSHRIYQLLIATLAIPLFLAISGSSALTYRYLSPQALLVLFGMLYFAIRGTINGDRVSKIFLAAWGVLLASTIVYIFRILGWISPSFWVYHAVDIGAGIESLLLAFALGEKLNQLAAEKDASNLKLLASTWELNHNLEENVNIRTQELKDLNKKLIWTNLKLQQLSDTDPLTGLMNRRQFGKRFKEDIARSSRMGTPLVFHIIDIDYFKKLNDALGHESGDHALQAFAKLMQEHWIRESDSIYRLGGEEFGILHPCSTDSDIDGHVAQFFTALADANIAHPKGLHKRLTCSIGSVKVTCDPDTTMDQIYNLADAALYEAKQSGRDRLVLRKLPIVD